MAGAIDFGRRSSEPELMDTEPVGFEEFRGCLRQLEVANRWSLAYRPTLAWLDRLVARHPDPARPLSILDVGCGHGDMLRRIARRAALRGVAVDLTGVDLNPWAKEAAERASPPGGPSIRYEAANVFDLGPERRFDAVVSALFAHHLADPELVRFLRWMEERTALGWFVNDLHRHPVPYHFLRLVFPAVGAHRFCIHDGPVSVTRAFTRDDWQRLLAEADLDPRGVEIAWWFPFRWGVGRLK